MSRTEWSGCAALVSVLYMNGRGGNFSLFPNSRGTGLNIITKAIMPRHMKIDQMELWLKCFEKSGHTKVRVRAPIPPHKLALMTLQAKRNNRAAP